MIKKISLAVCFAASILISASMLQAVTIEVGYAYSSLFDVTFKRIYPMFRKAHPDIEVKFRATYENYEDGANTIPVSYTHLTLPTTPYV